MPLALALIAALAAGSSPAPHEPWESAAYQACAAKSGGDTLPLHNCLVAEISRRDAELNAAYRDLLRRVPEEARRESFRKAERAWVAYRDAECDAEASGEAGGSIVPILIDTCVAKLTYERTRLLGQQIRGE